MKNSMIALVLSAGTLGLISGCSSPGYSGGWPTIQVPETKQTGENASNIMRTWHLDTLQISDDVNHLLLLDQPSKLNKWNVR
jgi:hypothetical protein